MTRNKFKHWIRMCHQLVRNCSAICYLPKPTVGWNKIRITDRTSFCIDILGDLFGLTKWFYIHLNRKKLTQTLFKLRMQSIQHKSWMSRIEAKCYSFRVFGILVCFAHFYKNYPWKSNHLSIVAFSFVNCTHGCMMLWILIDTLSFGPVPP